MFFFRFQTVNDSYYYYWLIQILFLIFVEDMDTTSGHTNLGIDKCLFGRIGLNEGHQIGTGKTGRQPIKIKNVTYSWSYIVIFFLCHSVLSNWHV